MGLKMKNFYITGVYKKPIVGDCLTRVRGLGQFVDLRGDFAEMKGVGLISQCTL